jgi:trans-aconitate methyltransferase
MKPVELQAGYGPVAEDYAREFCDEMSRKPFDRKMLDWLAEKVDGLGTICDLGCGAGQVAGYLRSRGASACGIDLSMEMIRQARRLNPEIDFQQMKAYLTKAGFELEEVIERDPYPDIEAQTRRAYVFAKKP